MDGTHYQKNRISEKEIDDLFKEDVKTKAAGEVRRSVDDAFLKDFDYQINSQKFDKKLNQALQDDDNIAFEAPLKSKENDFKTRLEAAYVDDEASVPSAPGSIGQKMEESQEEKAEWAKLMAENSPTIHTRLVERETVEEAKEWYKKIRAEKPIINTRPTQRETAEEAEKWSRLTELNKSTDDPKSKQREVQEKSEQKELWRSKMLESLKALFKGKKINIPGQEGATAMEVFEKKNALGEFEVATLKKEGYTIAGVKPRETDVDTALRLNPELLAAYLAKNFPLGTKISFGKKSMEKSGEPMEGVISTSIFRSGNGNESLKIMVRETGETMTLSLVDFFNLAPQKVEMKDFEQPKNKKLSVIQGGGAKKDNANNDEPLRQAA